MLLRELLPSLAVGALVTTGLTAQNKICTVYGTSSYDEFGRGVSGAGDVDKDGYPDFIVGGDEIGNIGFAKVYSGRDSRELLSLRGIDLNDTFGRAVGAAGDINRDGYDDVIVGAPEDCGWGKAPGFVRVFSGKNGSVLLTAGGDLGGDQFGSSVDGIGDVNGDGYPDLIVGAPQPGLLPQKGYIKIISGKDGKQLVRMDGLQTGDRFGWSVSAAGDMNGDKVPDFIVSAPKGAGNRGYVGVFSGKNGSVIFGLVGYKSGDEFGISVDGGTDVNGDGTPDILVGAHLEDQSAVDNGAVHLVSGKDRKTLKVLAGDSGSDTFGSAVAFGGDIDNDGTQDLLVGARFAKSKGAAYAISGKTYKRLQIQYGDANNDSFGAAIAAIGDVNKDGHADFIVGAPENSAKNLSSGLARVFSGKDLSLSTDVHQLSLKFAGTQKLSLTAGSAHANRLYHVFGSVTGALPGVTLNGVHIPLNVDVYTSITLAYANSTMLGNFRGKLDGTGKASASFNVPSGLPSLANMTLTHSFIVYDTSGRFYMASNPATLRLEN